MALCAKCYIENEIPEIFNERIKNEEFMRLAA